MKSWSVGIQTFLLYGCRTCLPSMDCGLSGCRISARQNEGSIFKCENFHHHLHHHLHHCLHSSSHYDSRSSIVEQKPPAQTTTKNVAFLFAPPKHEEAA